MGSRLVRTVVQRRCAVCARTLGFALWPWSGQWILTTHGLCDACYERTDPDAQPPPAERAPVVPARS